jgi:mono/diheme cytochrome c family protein
MRFLAGIAVGCVLGLVACSRQDASPPATQTSSLEPGAALASLERGARLFQENCALCHGPEGQGHPDWQTPGVVAAPPLNGTGNEWKRSRAEMIAIVQTGAKRNGVAVMPGWKDRLTDAEIADIVSWFQALWSPEAYAKWQRAQGGT